MLHVRPPNEFQGNLNNFGATLTDAGFGTSVTTGAANTKTAATQALLTTTEDAFGLAICFAGGATSAAVKQYLADIYFDSVIAIPNLLVNSATFAIGGYWYYFPIFIKSGTVIGVRAQCNAATQTLRVGVKAFTKPRRMDTVRCGSKVFAYGVTPASSNGTAITPGTSAYSAYVSVGSIAAGDEPWWWQAGLATNDTTMTATGYLMDVAVGSSTTQNMVVLHDVFCGNNNTTENMSKNTGVQGSFESPAQGVYIRAASLGAAPDTGVTVAAYGME